MIRAHALHVFCSQPNIWCSYSHLLIPSFSNAMISFRSVSFRSVSSSISCSISCSCPCSSLGTHVTAHINLIRKFRNVHLEPTLHLIKHLLIGLTRNKRNSNPLRPKPARSSHTMQELIGIIREIIIDDNIDTLNVNPTSEQIGGYENPRIEILE